MKELKLHRRVQSAAQRTPPPDDALAYALSVAENEGWPRRIPVEDGSKIARRQPVTRSSPLPG